MTSTHRKKHSDVNKVHIVAPFRMYDFKLKKSLLHIRPSSVKVYCQTPTLVLDTDRYRYQEFVNTPVTKASTGHSVMKSWIGYAPEYPLPEFVPVIEAFEDSHGDTFIRVDSDGVLILSTHSVPIAGCQF